MSFLNFAVTPLRLPPPGHESNFVDPPSQSWTAKIAVFVTLPVALAFLALREYARVKLRSKFSWDDWLCVAAGITSCAMCGLILATSWNGMYGRHAWDIPFSDIGPTILQETCAITALYWVASAFSKLSILALLYRLFSPFRWTRITIIAGYVLIVTSYAGLLAVWLAFSTPDAGERGEGGWSDPAYWLRAESQSPTASVAMGAVSTATDFMVFLVPLFPVSQLNMSLKRKMLLSALFATGLLYALFFSTFFFFCFLFCASWLPPPSSVFLLVLTTVFNRGCCFSAASLASRVRNYHSDVNEEKWDPFWTSMQVYALAIAEVNIGIICASVPTAFPLFKSFGEKLSSLGSENSSWRRYLKRKQAYPSSDTNGTDTTELKAALPPVPSGNMHTLLSVFNRRGSSAV
ncbi:integral membrane protein [Xylariaceae sp. FL0804]|nr:integral membrane protein [Xylariaceae sp. FL0804]